MQIADVAKGDDSGLNSRTDSGRRNVLCQSWIPGTEGLSNQTRILLTWGVVEVLHRGLNVGVAHPFLDAPDVGLGDDLRAERVTQVVKPQSAEAGTGERSLIPADKRSSVDIGTEVTEEHQVVIADTHSARPSFASASATSGAIGTERTFPDLGVDNTPSW